MQQSNRKTAVVTGASRGIGKGIALELAKRGYDLLITHLDEQDEVEEVAQRVTGEFGVRCGIAQADLRDEDAPRRVIEQAIQAFGQIHLLVNNAGVSLFDDIAELPPERLNHILQLNFRAPMLATRYASSHMIEQGIAGSIVYIASSRTERAYPGDAIYGGMKAGLVRAVQSIALDLAPHSIRVNTVSPGAIQVREQAAAFYAELGNRIPLGRAGKPEDIAKAVAWLSSEEASYITGINLRVDGGLILPGMPERIQATPADGWGKTN